MSTENLERLYFPETDKILIQTVITQQRLISFVVTNLTVHIYDNRRDERLRSLVTINTDFR